MSARNPFEPPKAGVADVVPSVRRPIVALVVLSLVAWYQLAWMWESSPMYLRLVSANALSPIGAVFATVGCAFLYVGLALVVFDGRRGGRPLLMAAGCLAVVALMWRALPGDGLAPFVLGITLALSGWILVHVRKRALSGHSESARHIP